MTASDRRCKECGKNYPLPPATVCHPCLKRLSEVGRFEDCHTPNIKRLNNNQDQDQDQSQDQDQALTPFGASPGPGCGLDDGPELHRLLKAWRDGQLEPVDVVLGDMPPWAGPVMRGIADDMRLLMGLRRAAGDDRPLPYASSMAVPRFAKDKPTASRAIGALVRAGVIGCAGSLPPRRAGDGTKLYEPPPAEVAELRRAA